MSETVLVIGAGDGGVIRELTRYPEIEHIDMAEIDPQVVEVCRKYLPADRLPPWTIPGCTIHLRGRAPKFIRSAQDKSLRPHHRGFHRPLRAGGRPVYPGVLRQLLQGPCRKTGSWSTSTKAPSTSEDAAACQRAHKRIVESFPISRVYQAHIPTYPSGPLALRLLPPRNTIPCGISMRPAGMRRGLTCRYYATTLHRGAFLCPRLCGGVTGRCGIEISRRFHGL